MVSGEVDMSKRFVDTAIWEKPWFRKLDPRLKLFWIFLSSRADCAGVWEPDFDLASFMIGSKVTAEDAVQFGDRVTIMDNGKWWLNSFCRFQYGPLNNSSVHKSIIKRLQYHDLTSLTP
jgi:hypothetical protein